MSLVVEVQKKIAIQMVRQLFTSQRVSRCVRSWRLFPALARVGSSAGTSGIRSSVGPRSERSKRGGPEQRHLSHGLRLRLRLRQRQCQCPRPSPASTATRADVPNEVRKINKQNKSYIEASRNSPVSCVELQGLFALTSAFHRFMRCCRHGREWTRTRIRTNYLSRQASSMRRRNKQQQNDFRRWTM